MNKINGILFDMDGTVLDSEGLFDQAQILLLKEYGINSSKYDLEEFKGMSYKTFYPCFMEKFNLVGEINDIRSKLRKYLHNIMETELKYINGFEAFYMNSIKNTNFKIGLVTNTTRLTYQKIQSCINIDKYFEFVLTVSESSEPKPSPKPYIESMEALSLKVNETLIIEDSITGLQSAIKSNARVIGLTTSLTENQIKDIDRNIIVANSYNDISAYISLLK